MAETDTAAHKTQLLELLAPILARVAALDPTTRTSQESQDELVDTLEREFPATGDHVRSIGSLVDEGVRAGWLCDRGDENARFSRIAKPTPETHNLSIDVVNMEGEAVEHTHPNGEVTIGFVVRDDGDPSFDAKPPGWVFAAPGSRHVPTVRGGRMTLVYFLPEGAVEWHFAS